MQPKRNIYRLTNRPADIEVLEPRTLASKTPLPRCGVMGDSYSDEYHFYPPDRSKAQGWVEQQVHNRRATFGTASGKSRGTPRFQGYANDWALSGATSSDLPAQTAGLASQAAAGKIDYATLFIGGDDFLNELVTLTDPSTAPSVFSTVAQTVITNIENAAGTLLASSPTLKIVLTTLPAITPLPIVTELANTPALKSEVQAADQAELAVNNALTAFAQSSPRLAVADFAGAAASLVASPIYKIGSVKVKTATAGDNPRNLFLADGLHLGTIGQGLLANVFINTIDNSFGAKIKPLSTRQILKDARLA